MNDTRILVVEDQNIVALDIAAGLTRLGYTAAATVASGEEAVQKAEELRPDLVLMDIGLTGKMDGIAAAQVIRDRLELPVIYLTAHADKATLERAKITEPFGYLLKPFEIRDLQTSIEMALYKHQMDRRLRESERWFSTLLRSIGDGVLATDSRGAVKFMNQAAAALTGWAPEDALGRDSNEVFQILSEPTRKPVPSLLLHALKEGATIGTPAPKLLLARDGSERPITATAAPIRDAKGNVTGGVLVFKDLSDRRQLEEQLRQAQKLEAVGRLAGGIAHDFNNLLTVINGYSSLLLSTMQSDNPWFLPVDEILKAGNRAASLTQQLLAFSRKQMIQPVILNLNDIVAGMEEMLRRLIGENITLDTILSPDLSPLHIDRSQVEQALLNLVVNARDAMPRGGTIYIQTANVEGPAPPGPPDAPARSEVLNSKTPEPVGASDLQPGRYVQLRVRDTGTGMDAQTLAHLYEPFFTTKGQGQGTGLGLATVYGIVKQNQGHIAVDSKVGQGSTFTIYLPAAHEPSPPPAPRLSLADAPRGQEKILVVEDEVGVRTLIHQILQALGYNVRAARHGGEALALLARLEGPMDLLVTDVVMPGISGRELADRLVTVWPRLKVLFLSSYADAAVLHPGMETEKTAFLEKPFDPCALARKVREVLDAAPT